MTHGIRSAGDTGWYTSNVNVSSDGENSNLS